MGNFCSCFGKDKESPSAKNIPSNTHSSDDASTKTSRKSHVRLAVQDVISHVKEGERKSLDETQKEYI